MLSIGATGGRRCFTMMPTSRRSSTLLGEASERAAVRLLGCCLMPNHVHLVVRPTGEADLSRWMRGNRGQATFKVGKTGNLTYDGRFAFRVE